jgi:alpha-beta hydrolase superfamily lysophospholipase
MLKMDEILFDPKVKGESIYGIWHRPELKNPPQKNVAVVFLHGWAGHRSGPHDMLVKLARKLSAGGYNCFRFDFRGKGYSHGCRQQTNNHSMIEDLDAVLCYVNTVLNHPAIVLTGICSGAKLALYYARSGNLPVTHVIELSSPALRQQEAESELAANRAGNTLNEYVKKIFRRETWNKLTNGEIHFSAIRRNLSKPIYGLLSKKKKISTSGKKAVNPVQKPGEKPFGKFQGQMLLIHGEKDPETKPALRQIQDMLHRHNIPSDTYVVKGANHSFYSLSWEYEIIKKITEWLSGNYNS